MDKKNKIISNSLLGIIFTTIFLMIHLLEGKVAFGHDFSFHATNIFYNVNGSNFFSSIFFPVKVFSGQIAHGFGYGTGIFYPPLSYILGGIASRLSSLLGLNQIYGITILEVIITFFSGFTMYIFSKRIFNNSYTATLSSISYISAPYFLCDIYTRSALGELLTFIFIPIVFLSIYELLTNNNRKFLMLFVIGYTGMILSHLVLTIFLTIFVIIVLLTKIKKILKPEKIKVLLIATCLVLLITSLYWLPLLEHKILGNYVVFESNSMWNIGTINSNALKFRELFKYDYKGYDNIVVYLNMGSFIMSLITILFIKQKITDTKKLDTIMYSTILVIISFLISSIYFPWSVMPEFIKKIQFPWRMCIFMTFGLSIIAGCSLIVFKEKKRKVFTLIFSILVIIFGIKSIDYQRTTYTNAIECTSMGAENEYLPVSTKNNLEYYETRSNVIIVKKGMAEIVTSYNSPSYYKAKINLNSENVTLELPRIYYLGYQITITDNDNKKEKISYKESNNGFVEVTLNKSGTIEIIYTGTLLLHISRVVGYLTITCFVIYLIYSNRKGNKIAPK